MGSPCGREGQSDPLLGVPTAAGGRGGGVISRLAINEGRSVRCGVGQTLLDGDGAKRGKGRASVQTGAGEELTAALPLAQIQTGCALGILAYSSRITLSLTLTFFVQVKYLSAPCRPIFSMH